MKNYLTLLVACFAPWVFAETSEQDDDDKDIAACLAIEVVKASEHTRVAELRAKCAAKNNNNRIEQRDKLEKQAAENRFAILPYKPNYLLPVTFSGIERRPYQGIEERPFYHDFETKFQISLKHLIAEDLLIKDLDLEFAVTLASWWQSANGDISAPFRETNYEPELIFNWNRPWSLLGLPVAQSYLSLNHQSNGQSGILSRSWNRVIAGLVFAQTDNVTWSLRGWWRLPEDEKESLFDPKGDDNPHIERYLGYGELGAVWNLSDTQTLEMIWRNNLRSDNRGSIQLGWSFPLTKRLLGYVEYFNGYGESLIYYNHHIQRLGFGVKLTNWL